ncbi:hypothetical protein L1049_023243 [Liquidambar formosana]|uniref:EF-hand domain-containing protein n=1 Tax=Liquidambar formosana TaxID=63359 RepID=A0AAP0RDR7_LIQFO
MVREIDKYGYRLIDLNAFTKLNTNGFNSHEVMENLKDVFAVYELDGNGSTSADELHEPDSFSLTLPLKPTPSPLMLWMLSLPPW